MPLCRPIGANGVLTLVNTTLLLPAPELQYMHARAMEDPVFGIQMEGKHVRAQCYRMHGPQACATHGRNMLIRVASSVMGSQELNAITT